MPGTRLGTEDLLMNKMDPALALVGFEIEKI